MQHYFAHVYDKASYHILGSISQANKCYPYWNFSASKKPDRYTNRAGGSGIANNKAKCVVSRGR